MAKFPTSRGLFSLVFGGPEEKKTVFGGPEEKKTAAYGADYEVACFFCPLPIYGYYMGFIGNDLFLADFI